MTSLASRSLGVPPTQNTATVHEYRCLYTHDIRQKSKRWHDGFSRFHTFNNRVMLYDLPRNFVGDTYQADVQEGDEFSLGLVLVQVQERLATTETDLTKLLTKRPSKASNTPTINGTRKSYLQQPPTTRNPVTPVRLTGRAYIDQVSPFEHRQIANQENVQDLARRNKRPRTDDHHVSLWQILKTSKAPRACPLAASNVLPRSTTMQPPAKKSKGKTLANQGQPRLKVKEIIDLASSANSQPNEQNGSVPPHAQREISRPRTEIHRLDTSDEATNRFSTRRKLTKSPTRPRGSNPGNLCLDLTTQSQPKQSLRIPQRSHQLLSGSPQRAIVESTDIQPGNIISHYSPQRQPRDIMQVHVPALPSSPKISVIEASHVPANAFSRLSRKRAKSPSRPRGSLPGNLCLQLSGHVQQKARRTPTIANPRSTSPEESVTFPPREARPQARTLERADALPHDPLSLPLSAMSSSSPNLSSSNHPATSSVTNPVSPSNLSAANLGHKLRMTTNGVQKKPLRLASRAKRKMLLCQTAPSFEEISHVVSDANSQSMARKEKSITTSPSISAGGATELVVDQAIRRRETSAPMEDFMTRQERQKSKSPIPDIFHVLDDEKMHPELSAAIQTATTHGRPSSPTREESVDHHNVPPAIEAQPDHSAACPLASTIPQAVSPPKITIPPKATIPCKSTDFPRPSASAVTIPPKATLQTAVDTSLPVETEIAQPIPKAATPTRPRPARNPLARAFTMPKRVRRASNPSNAASRPISLRKTGSDLAPAACANSTITESFADERGPWTREAFDLFGGCPADRGQELNWNYAVA